MSHLTYFCSIMKKNRMLADFYIPLLSNDMKNAVQKNHVEGQILYRSLVLSKKTASLPQKRSLFPDLTTRVFTSPRAISIEIQIMILRAPMGGSLMQRKTTEATTSGSTEARQTMPDALNISQKRKRGPTHDLTDAVFYSTYSLLYQNFGNMVIFRSGNLN